MATRILSKAYYPTLNPTTIQQGLQFMPYFGPFYCKKYMYGNFSFGTYLYKPFGFNKKLLGLADWKSHPNHIEIYNFKIHPEYRGKGFGTWLLNDTAKYSHKDKLVVSFDEHKLNTPEFVAFLRKNNFTMADNSTMVKKL
jgi:ribosomal protein S18 acetylase RimI-like enzyme